MIPVDQYPHFKQPDDLTIIVRRFMDIAKYISLISKKLFVFLKN